MGATVPKVDQVINHTAVPSGLHDSMQAATNEPDWCADFADFALPVVAGPSSCAQDLEPSSTDTLVSAPPVGDIPAAYSQFPSAPVAPGDASNALPVSFSAVPAETLPALTAPAFAPVASLVNPSASLEAPIGVDEVERLKQQLRALQAENDALKGAPQHEIMDNKPGFIV